MLDRLGVAGLARLFEPGERPVQRARDALGGFRQSLGLVVGGLFLALRLLRACLFLLLGLALREHRFVWTRFRRRIQWPTDRVRGDRA